MYFYHRKGSVAFCDETEEWLRDWLLETLFFAKSNQKSTQN